MQVYTSWAGARARPGLRLCSLLGPPLSLCGDDQWYGPFRLRLADSVTVVASLTQIGSSGLYIRQRNVFRSSAQTLRLTGLKVTIRCVECIVAGGDSAIGGKGLIDGSAFPRHTDHN